jgi:hypothetical protein
MKPSAILVGAALCIAGLFAAIASLAYTQLQGKTPSGAAMTKTAAAFVSTLDAEQKGKTVLAFDTPQRFAWHFIPLETRKGLRIREMNDKQRDAAHALLKTSLSELGYTKATKIMELEEVLAQLEKDTEHKRRDPEKYYFTLFGEPKPDGRWGLSVEGHHLSFNYVVDKGQVVASTPQFMATNPSIVQQDYSDRIKKGERVLAKEELLAFDLVNMLDDNQKKTAIIGEKAPADIRGPAEPQAPQTKPEGISVKVLNDGQKETLRKLIGEYLAAMPADVASVRNEEIEEASFDNLYFCWMGATKPGIGHYYRVQGPTMLIEFVNVQPDAAGNPASHIHCVWRDPRGDFGVPVK